MQKQRLQVFPKDDGKLNNVQKKGLSILLWVKRERRYTTAVTVRPEAEKTWTGDAASDNWDRILDFGGHCDAVGRDDARFAVSGDPVVDPVVAPSRLC